MGFDNALDIKSRAFFVKIKFMKYLGKIFFGLLVLVAVFVYMDKPVLAEVESKFYFSYCDQPIKYRIDTVDPRFGITKDQFLTDIQQATKIWDDAEGKELFEYAPSGAKDDLAVSLIYDER